MELQPIFKCTVVVMRTESLVSLQSCCNIDMDTWCKWTLRKGTNPEGGSFAKTA